MIQYVVLFPRLCGQLVGHRLLFFLGHGRLGAIEVFPLITKGHSFAHQGHPFGHQDHSFCQQGLPFVYKGLPFAHQSLSFAHQGLPLIAKVFPLVTKVFPLVLDLISLFQLILLLQLKPLNCNKIKLTKVRVMDRLTNNV